ncbi:glutathione S-transferase kappa 1-like [Bufo gargarizans]|uniref:glutathione S-transferase kappa 1-like n=1 Tax=Bufo gargarizans TaxID=30331 RepID=UPI001CF4F471|nr:glutathione S-transferase kappa 1-like [Bufo gargarizans]
MSKRKVLELFYDVVSPYSWLGFEILLRYKNIWNVDVQLRPGYLAAIMNATGNSPPAMVPKRGAYLAKDLERLAEFYQVPVQEPTDFFHVMVKKGSLSAMRFVTAVQMSNPEFVERVSRELWLRIWSEDKDITEPDSILQAGKKAGIPEDQAKNILSTIASPEVKNKLKETTEKALQYGAFGMPSIVAHINEKPELFFGSDRFELLAHRLGEKWLGPVPQKSHL